MYEQIACENICKLVNNNINDYKIYDEKGQVQTTYKSDYTVKELPERVERKMRTVVINLPFEGTTTYKHDYRVFELPQVERKEKIRETMGIPFEGISTYTSDYSLRAWEYYIKR